MRSALKTLFVLAASTTLAFTGCSGGSSGGSGGTVNPPVTTTLTLSVSALNFSSNVGTTSPVQYVVATSTGTTVVNFTSLAITGANASSFAQTNTCGPVTGSSCAVSVTFTPTGSGTATASLVFTDNATGSPQTVTLTGTGSAVASAGNTVDCSVGAGTCPDTFTGAYTTANSQLATDPISAGGFHGYADPSMRRDPNSAYNYYAYSWAKTLGDGTHVVDLHLAYSTNTGASFTYLGPLYQSAQTAQTASTAYSSVNDSSTETVDLLPIALTGASAGQTMWVQAHQSYLVAPQGGIYDQLNATNLISVSAVQVATPASPGTALLGLSTAPEARLGAAGTDPSRNVTTNLIGLSTTASKCANWGQPALWYQAPYLYLGLECTEFSGTGQLDANELAHYLYVTTPTGADASKWAWAYVGIFATPTQAATLGATATEKTTYQFFTEPEFVATQSGQLALLLTPGVFNTSPGATQPVIQYGCRLVPVTSLSPTGITLQTDVTTGAPVVLAKVTENDLYSGVNEGPAACTYEPTATNGIIMGRKFENDPTYGFYLYPLNSGVRP